MSSVFYHKLERSDIALTHSHSETVHSPDEMTQRAYELLKESGFKLTKKRRELIDIFSNDQRYFKATEIHERLSADRPTMSYNTTYRNLYDFAEIGILEMTEYNQEQMFKVSCFPNTHHHHFICTQCGKVIPIHACPMDQVESDLSGAEIQSHRFEVFGLCPQCAQAG
ncbi:transcriptional repressor [Aerococcaceae bacterium DSM 111020]|nr:transcriptional repressor [Aerococcaceae bacterium DSM 111020]